MSSISRSRVLATGVLWALVYNLVWAAAWFAFMRREWIDAAAAVGQPLFWTPRFWVVWVTLTVPIGVAMMAYIASRARHAPVLHPALAASLALWVVGTIGMAIWGWQESLSMRVLTIDSAVNLVALVAASLAGEWSLRVHLERRKSAPMRLE